MGDMTCTLVGFDVFSRTLLALPDRIQDLGGDALKRELDQVMARSKELVPVLTTDLQESGGVSDPKYVVGQVVVRLAYGGDNGEVAYALLQHETEAFVHPNGGEWKFLERPLLEWTRQGPRRVGAAIAAGLR